MDAKPPVSTSKRPPQYRQAPCAECGAMLDLTYLWPGRQYRCPQCGGSFRQHRRAPGDDQTRVVSSNIARRMVLSALAVIGMVWLVVWVASLQIEAYLVWLIAVGSSASASILTLFLRRISWDSTAISGSVMFCTGLGVFVLSTYAENPTPEAVRTMTLCSLMWVMIGAVQFARFYRSTTFPEAKLAAMEQAPLPPAPTEQA